MLVAVVILVLSYAVVIGVVTAAARGQLGVNALAGIRIPSVTASDAAWRAGHRASLPAVVVGCAVGTVATVLPLVTGWREVAAGASILVGCGALLAGTTVGAVSAHRAAVRVAAGRASDTASR
jgi:hypothetical protein